MSKLSWLQDSLEAAAETLAQYTATRALDDSQAPLFEDWPTAQGARPDACALDSLLSISELAWVQDSLQAAAEALAQYRATRALDNHRRPCLRSRCLHHPQSLTHWQLTLSPHVWLQDSLEAAAEALAQYRATRALDDSQAPLFEAACGALCSTLAPYICDCLSQASHPCADVRGPRWHACSSDIRPCLRDFVLSCNGAHAAHPLSLYCPAIASFCTQRASLHADVWSARCRCFLAVQRP